MEERKPKISIITPVYNMERYLRECVDSILAQTLKDWELILVEDGSTDRSAEICREYADKDPRVRVIERENGGVSAARNAAIREARGEYVGFVDSDDWIEPGMMELLLKNMEEYGADVSVCGYVFEWKDRSKPRHEAGGGVKVYERDEALMTLFRDRPLQSMLCDKLWRRELMQDELPVGYYFEDHATTIKWVGNARRLVFDPTPMYHYRMRRGSTVNGVNPERRFHFLLAELGRVDYLKKIGLLDAQDPAAGAERVLEVGLDVAKNIARYRGDDRMTKEYIERVREALTPYMGSAERVLKGKKLRRIKRLKGDVKGFVRGVRLSRIFEFGRRRKEKNLYE